MDTFVSAWLEGWNAHDVDDVLTHFRDDVIFTSPTAARVLDHSDGVIRGIRALGDYWRFALSLNQDLRFELIGIYQGIDMIIINYRTQTGALVNELLRFADDGLVVEGHSAYLATGTAT